MRTNNKLKILSLSILLILVLLSLTSCTTGFNQGFANNIGQSQGTQILINNGYASTPTPNGTVLTRTTTIGTTTYVTTITPNHGVQYTTYNTTY